MSDWPRAASSESCSCEPDHSAAAAPARFRSVTVATLSQDQFADGIEARPPRVLRVGCQRVARVEDALGREGAAKRVALGDEHFCRTCADHGWNGGGEIPRLCVCPAPVGGVVLLARVGRVTRFGDPQRAAEAMAGEVSPPARDNALGVGCRPADVDVGDVEFVDRIRAETCEHRVHPLLSGLPHVHQSAESDAGRWVGAVDRAVGGCEHSRVLLG